MKNLCAARNWKALHKNIPVVIIFFYKTAV